VTKFTKKLRYAMWALNGRFGRKITVESPQMVTVLITYFHPARMKHINAQIGNILKCSFVDKVVVSNHNADIKIEEKVSTRSERVVFINQSVSRACGYRWRLAKDLGADYLVAVDDDVLLFPNQLKTLFEHLINEPDIPHGFSGMLQLDNNAFQYREQENIDVHYLCEVYAVTKNHVERYSKIEDLLAEEDSTLPDTVERLGDFIVISQTGSANPRIHQTQRLFRSDTFKTIGIANHKDEKFIDSITEVSQAVERIRPHLRSREAC